MIALIQRVNKSSVSVDGKEVAAIGKGLNILLGVFDGDTQEDINKLINKIVKLRIFSDECGKMNLSIQDIGGKVLVVSQFTLAGSVKKGNRPSFSKAMPPIAAKELYLEFIEKLNQFIEVENGVFGATMQVEINNDGPVTFILDSTKL